MTKLTNEEIRIKVIDATESGFKVGYAAGKQVGIDEGKSLAIAECIKEIDRDLFGYSSRLDNPELPEMCQANLSGMIIALKSLRNKLQAMQETTK